MGVSQLLWLTASYIFSNNLFQIKIYIHYISIILYIQMQLNNICRFWVIADLSIISQDEVISILKWWNILSKLKVCLCIDTSTLSPGLREELNVCFIVARTWLCCKLILVGQDGMQYWRKVHVVSLLIDLIKIARYKIMSSIFSKET